MLLALLAQAATYVCAAGVWQRTLMRAGHPQKLKSLIPLGLAKLFMDQAVPSGGISGTMLVRRILEYRWRTCQSNSVRALAAIAVFSFPGATPFMLYSGPRDPVNISNRVIRELRMMTILTALAVVSLTLILALYEGQPWAAAARNGAFLGVSAQTTTGYTLTSSDGLSNLSIAALLLIMIVGGASGSTAGGLAVCAELGLNDTVIPDHAIAWHLADMVEGGSDFDLSATVRGDARLISIEIGDVSRGRVSSGSAGSQSEEGRSGYVDHRFSQS